VAADRGRRGHRASAHDPGRSWLTDERAFCAPMALATNLPESIISVP
jgi:hypothetical protein